MSSLQEARPKIYKVRQMIFSVVDGIVLVCVGFYERVVLNELG